MAEKGLFCGVNKPADPQNLSEMEKKHIPVIDCPGEIAHVMEEGHHIQWIDLYSGSNFLAKVLLTPAFTRAEATVTLVKSGKHRIYPQGCGEMQPPRPLGRDKGDRDHRR